MIEMQVMGIAIDTKSGSPIVVLNDVEKRRALPIWIGQAEASAIIRQLENIKTPRPMTHDLISNLLDLSSFVVEKIEINDYSDTTYYATIFIKGKKNEKFKLDARPSDAITIALKNKAPIFVTPNVIADGTISTDEERDEQESEEFKKFVNDIKPSDFKNLLENFEKPEGFNEENS
ncbi:MAG: bifunctional nuclease family protein [bacterium]